jgi:hypothetical protein
MYALERGDDGRPHGPINKKAYGTVSSRKAALRWARRQATRRGFPPGTARPVQVLPGGEACPERQTRELFPDATLTLDIRHARRRPWEVGRVPPQPRALHFAGPGGKQRRKVHGRAIERPRERADLVRHGRWQRRDLVLAGGVVEGAARYVIGERLGQGGTRWREGGAEAALLPRRVEGNGDRDASLAISEGQRQAELRQGKEERTRSQPPTRLPQLSEEAERGRRRRKAKAAA